MAYSQLSLIEESRIDGVLRTVLKRLKTECASELIRQREVYVRDGVWICRSRDGEGIAAGLEGEDRFLLNPTFSNLRKNAAGRVLLSNKSTLLCHTGHLGGNNRPVPKKEFLDAVEGFEEVVVDEERLIVIGAVEDSNFPSALARFIRECVRIRTFSDPEVVEKTIARSGFDPGAKDGHERRSTKVEARHNSVATALKHEVERLEWRIVERSMRVRPDLLVRKGRRSVLFEVKPDGTLNSFMVAVGQLLTYSTELSPDMRIVVAKEPEPRVEEMIERTLRAANIQFCPFREEDEISFPQLPAVMAAVG